jgi:hypothetical protein
MDFPLHGEVSERFKEHAWKACVGETQPWVQIPPSPPYLKQSHPVVLFTFVLQNATLLVAIVEPCMAQWVSEAGHNTKGAGRGNANPCGTEIITQIDNVFNLVRSEAGKLWSERTLK